MILRLDDREITVVQHLFAELRQHQPGDEVTLELKRDGETKTIEVTLTQRAAQP